MQSAFVTWDRGSRDLFAISRSLEYDGSFTGALVPGWGVAAQLFRDAGITVLDESQVHRLDVSLGPARS